MALYLLFESTSGYALFQLARFTPFLPAVDAMNQCNAISEGIMTDELINFLVLNLPKVKEWKKAKFTVGVMEPNIGSRIIEATGIPCESDDYIQELLCAVRLHFG